MSHATTDVPRARLEPLDVPLDQRSIYLDGAWVPAHSSAVVTEINPATEEALGTAPESDADDVDAAVRAARAALTRAEWADTTAADRGRYLTAMADRCEQRAAELSALVTAENGAVTARTRGNAMQAAALLRYYGQLGQEVATEEVRGSTLVVKEPVGVAGLIVPWNSPIVLAAQKLAPALLAGCSMVVKPSAETSLSAAFFADMAEAAGLPAGVLNIVTGDRATGAALVEHDDVDKIAFTGSTQAGRAIAAVCGGRMRPATFELGGKSAAILLDDADLGTFLTQMPSVCMGSSGQGCLLSTRILVARSRYDEVCAGIVDTLAGLQVGAPDDPDTVFGPLAAERQRDRVEGYIASGRSDGARLALGGGRPKHLPVGFYVEPTVFVDVDNSMRIAQEEIFGPVVTVAAFDTDREAVAIANDSIYGLGGTVFTADRDRGLTIARQVRTGTIGVNCYTLDMNAPFGGVKQSGMGRERGPEALMSYQQYKSIYLG